MREGRPGQKTPLEKHLENVKNNIPLPENYEGGDFGLKYKNYILFTDMSDPDGIGEYI